MPAVLLFFFYGQPGDESLVETRRIRIGKRLFVEKVRA